MKRPPPQGTDDHPVPVVLTRLKVDEHALLKLWRAHPERQAAILAAARGTKQERLRGAAEVVRKRWPEAMRGHEASRPTASARTRGKGHREVTPEEWLRSLAQPVVPIQQVLWTLADETGALGFVRVLRSRDRWERLWRALDSAKSPSKFLALAIVHAGAVEWFTDVPKRATGESAEKFLHRVHLAVMNATAPSRRRRTT